MNITLTENSIMELLHTRVTHRPAIVLEGYHHLSITEQQQIDESYNAVYDLLMDQVIAEMSIGGAKAKLKGAVAGAKAGFQGDQNAGNVGKNTEIQSLFDDVKKNIGTIVAQHKNDLAKMGMSAEDPAMQKLASMEQAISSGGSGIEVKDNSAMAKVKQFGAEKVLPVVMKAVSPVMKKVEDLYNKSGPIKDFDTKYQQLITQFTEKHPNMAEPISKFSEMAKKHKGKATFIIGGLTALLTATGALAAGGVGAFVIGVGLRGIYGVLAGEPPAKAFGKAAITAAVGKLVGGAFKDLFGDVDLSGADEMGTKHAIGQATGAMDAGDVGMDSYEDLVAKGEVGDDIVSRMQFGGDVTAGEKWAANWARDYSDGLSPEYVHDVLQSPELQPYFMDGETVNMNKFGGVVDMLKNNADGMNMPGKEEFGDILDQHLNGGGEAAEDVVGNTVTSEPSQIANSISNSISKGGITYPPGLVQNFIDHPELKNIIFGDGDTLTFDLNTQKQFTMIQRLIHADPNLDTQNLDGVAAALKDPSYVSSNIKYANELMQHYNNALNSSGRPGSEEFYQNALAKYNELKAQGVPKPFSG